MNNKYSPRILGIITARGGSKSIPNKNIFPILGKPLIFYSIVAAINSKMISKTIVTSDNDEILHISQELGAYCLKRPSQFSTDKSTSEEVIIHTLNTLKLNGEEFEYFVLLQPTSPLRTALDIDKSLSLLIDNNASAVISVVSIGIKPFKSCFLNEHGYLQGVHSNNSPNLRRQDLPEAYLANGAIYGCVIREFIEKKTFLLSKTIPYFMQENQSIDIDDIEDIKVVEKILVSQGNVH